MSREERQAKVVYRWRKGFLGALGLEFQLAKRNKGCVRKKDIAFEVSYDLV